jgi:hypothetical protein
MFKTLVIFQASGTCPRTLLARYRPESALPPRYRADNRPVQPISTRKFHRYRALDKDHIGTLSARQRARSIWNRPDSGGERRYRTDSVTFIGPTVVSAESHVGPIVVQSSLKGPQYRPDSEQGQSGIGPTVVVGGGGVGAIGATTESHLSARQWYRQKVIMMSV